MSPDKDPVGSLWCWPLQHEQLSDGSHLRPLSLDSGLKPETTARLFRTKKKSRRRGNGQLGWKGVKWFKLIASHESRTKGRPLLGQEQVNCVHQSSRKHECNIANVSWVREDFVPTLISSFRWHLLYSSSNVLSGVCDLSSAYSLAHEWYSMHMFAPLDNRP